MYTVPSAAVIGPGVHEGVADVVVLDEEVVVMEEVEVDVLVVDDDVAVEVVVEPI